MVDHTALAAPNGRFFLTPVLTPISPDKVVNADKTNTAKGKKKPRNR